MNPWMAKYDRSLGWVYFIRCEDFIKIGWAKYPLKRMADMQVCNPFPMTLLGVLGPGPMVEIESYVQQEFKEFRARGEWFRYAGKLKEFLDDGGARPYDPECIMDVTLKAVPKTKVVCVMHGQHTILAAFPERDDAETFANMVIGRPLSDLSKEMANSWLPKDLPRLLYRRLPRVSLRETADTVS